MLGRLKYSFTHRHNDELDLQFNDIVNIVSKDIGVNGWMEVKFRGNIGKVPSAYIQEINTPYIGCTGIADFSFTHPTEGETGQFLSFEKGDKILVIDRPTSGWCVGIRDSHIGLYPENYVIFDNEITFNDIENLLKTSVDDCFIYSQYLCNAADVSATEGIARDLVLIFEKDNRVIELINSVIDNEVTLTTNEGTLFRKNSIASHLMSQYARLIGKEYLSKTLKPVIQHIQSSNVDFEIDPHKISDINNLERNINSLQRATQNFLLEMMSSVNNFPMALRTVCQKLQQTVVKRFPTAKRKVVGGFFFLRFICPAVVSPDGFGVVDSIDNNTRRSLILMSKILQTLSNGVMFGVKEPYMKPMNTFIKENLENSHFILDKLAFTHPDIPTERLPEMTEDEYKLLKARVHNVFSLCKSKYYRLMKEDNMSDDEINHIASLIIRLGPTPKKPAKVIQKKQISNTSNASNTPTSERKRSKTSFDKPKRVKKQLSKTSNIAPVGSILVKSCLAKKHNTTVKQWRKRYYALYTGSTKLFAYNNNDDPSHLYVDSIELAPSFEVTPMGKTKNGWEFALRTLEKEFNFVCQQENDMRSWIAYLDRRKKEILMPNADRQQKSELVTCLEEKMKMYIQEKESIKVQLKNTSDSEKISSLSTHFEELVTMMEILQKSIEDAKASISK